MICLYTCKDTKLESFFTNLFVDLRQAWHRHLLSPIKAKVIFSHRKLEPFSIGADYYRLLKLKCTLAVNLQWAEPHMWNHVTSPSKTVTCIYWHCVYKDFSLHGDSHLQLHFIFPWFKGCTYFPLSNQGGIPCDFSGGEIAGCEDAY